MLNVLENIDGPGSRKEFIAKFSCKTWFEMATAVLRKDFTLLLVTTVGGGASDGNKVFWTSQFLLKIL